MNARSLSGSPASFSAPTAPAGDGRLGNRFAGSTFSASAISTKVWSSIFCRPLSMLLIEVRVSPTADDRAS
jgi:hypothetical protein